MSHVSNLRGLITEHRQWVALVVPLLVNGAMWLAVVMPRHQALQRHEGAQGLIALKPRFVALLEESQRLLMEGSGSANLTGNDASAAMQVIERLAGRCRLEIAEMRAGERSQADAGRGRRGRGRTEPAASTVPIDVSLSGRFQKLANWMSDVEGEGGLRIDSFTLTSAEQPDGDHQLTVKLSVLLGAA